MVLSSESDSEDGESSVLASQQHILNSMVTLHRLCQVILPKALNMLSTPACYMHAFVYECEFAHACVCNVCVVCV
jgi:hypothetical protein